MKRNRVNVIYWALLVSLCVHAAFAPLAQHLKVVDAAKDQPPDIIHIDRHPKPPPPEPTPRPTPKPHVTKKPAAHAQPAVAAPHVHAAQPVKGGAHRPGLNHRPVARIDKNLGTGGTFIGTGDETSSPEPTATPKPSCSAPLVDASTIEKYSPEMPAAAHDAGLSGTAQVKVDLSATGSVLDASIAVTSGSTILDAAALVAAKRTTYAPKVVDCRRVPGSYLFRVEFDG